MASGRPRAGCCVRPPLPPPRGPRPRMPAPRKNRFTFIIGAPPPPPMSSKGWWIGMAVAAAVVYYGTYSFLPFK